MIGDGALLELAPYSMHRSFVHAAERSDDTWEGGQCYGSQKQAPSTGARDAGLRIIRTFGRLLDEAYIIHSVRS